MNLDRKQISQLIEKYGRYAKLGDVLLAHGFECPACKGTGSDLNCVDDPCTRGGSITIVSTCRVCVGKGSTPKELKPKMVSHQEGWE